MSLPIRELIAALKQNHIVILTNLEDINQMISGSLEFSRKQYLSVKPNLRSLQAIVFDHFQLQNKDLYDKIKSDLSGDVGKDVEFLIEDLKEFKIKTLMFFDEHPADMGDINPRNFKATFHIYSSQVHERMSAEKDFLFPLLEKLVV